MLTNRQLTCAVLTTFLVCLAVTPAGAGNINSSAGTSAFSFLKINVGGRAVGMGSAFTGLADDEAALYYNPAGLVSFVEQRFIAEYHNYFAGLQSGFAGYVHPLGENRAYGLQVSYLNYGEFTQTDRAGNVEGTFGGGDLMLAGSFALRRSHEFTLGVSAKFIYEKIQDYSATGLAVDLGARYMADRARYGGGLLIQNLGTQLSSLGEGENSGLPTTLRAGLSARPPGLNTILATDLIVPFDKPNLAVSRSVGSGGCIRAWLANRRLPGLLFGRYV